ncbi:hypothetical protein GOBAR_DD36833 [Gossypium barbadense]|nr:hypothetical protein GOBAR_DD36833 [Gossypium barbadense]
MGGKIYASYCDNSSNFHRSSDTRSKARQMRSKLNRTIQEFVSKALDAYTKERENQDFKYWESWSKTPNLAAKAHWISITSINDSISVGDGSQAQILEGKNQLRIRKVTKWHVEERRENSACVSSQDQAKPKVLPQFESYIVEEEEGSGGYGTVYRARRKDDGALVAIKCPHASAHKNYVSNELKMLERFGGRNFVIRYEGCIKSANSDCLVLQYVEHDRPEMLKKEIDVFQLQWYAYCLFKGLANLHKQGIVHRDVKPGNFLFSCKTNKGYLIDFNLAMDLHQKSRSVDKSKMGYDLSLHHNSVPAKVIHPANSSKFLNAKSREGINIEMTSSRLTLEPKNMKKATDKRKAHNDVCSWNKINSQGADGSGITSAKDVLFRSQHQGSKIDIWSAGVTLLYLMIGKSPIFGDPEQNIKDIAKLRGSEDLWEVAKLHNRECSFPEDLYGKQYLTSMSLREWCQMNTKRRDFLKEIPSSLYDLVDKCLTVNPRVRITAEDALKHEFLASIHENLRKQRAFKQGLSSNSGTNSSNNLLLGGRISKSLKVSL